MSLTKIPSSMTSFEGTTFNGEVRSYDSVDQANFVGGASGTANRIQICGASHPSTPNVITMDTNGSEKFRIDSSGNLLVGKTSATANGGDVQVSKGITFPATQVACSDANTLDDYEEGTWTPTVNLLGTITYNTAIGRYTKVGNVVTVTFSLILSSTNTTQDSTIFVIGGLPFGVLENTGSGAMMTENVVGITSSGTHAFVPYAIGTTTNIQVVDTNYNVAIAGKSQYTPIYRTCYTGSSMYLVGQITYFAS